MIEGKIYELSFNDESDGTKKMIAALPVILLALQEGRLVIIDELDAKLRRFIELGPEFQNQVVVERGLVPGETIVVEGYHKLSPGVKVKVNNALLKKEDEDQSQTPDSAKTEK